MKYKKELVKIGLGLLYIIGVYSLILYLSLTFWEIYALIITITFIRQLIASIKVKTKVSIKSFIKTSIILLIIFYLLKYLYIWFGAFWGFLLGCLAISGWIIYVKRKQWLIVKHRVEAQIWGKPIKDLPKDYFKK
jgi:hypothetical protein